MATLSIGRQPDCDIVLGDPTVSRRHAEISEIGPDLYVVVDHGSTSGSFCFEQGGWKRFTSMRLRGTDRLRLGAFESSVGELLRKTRKSLPEPQRRAAAAPRIERDPATGQIVVHRS